MTVIALIFFLLVVYQVKHFLADYILQGSYMLGKFKDGWDWVLPLLAHVGVHAALTYFISMAVFIMYPIQFGFMTAVELAFLDAAIHFGMDRLKAGKKYLGRFKALSAAEMSNILSYRDTIGLDHFKPQLRGNRYFWLSLGADQACHHLTHYGLIYLMLVAAGIL
jgi:hypothetical protein